METLEISQWYLRELHQHGILYLVLSFYIIKYLVLMIFQVWLQSPYFSQMKHKIGYCKLSPQKKDLNF